VVRGVTAVRVSPGRAPAVRFVHGGRERLVECLLVVGADGGRSLVRKALGIPVRATAPSAFGVGMLVDGLSSWPADTAAIGTEGNVHYGVFPRRDGRARLYLFCAPDDRARLSGPGAAARFLASFRLACLPGTEQVGSARPAGPCAGFPMRDTWTEEPSGKGVVLIGDAAGASDAVIGQGLSVALSDAAALASILTSSRDWSPRALRGYGDDRAERMRRSG
jgi:2-polyprenyl-6-methoxyphenol hydroxylase-like FAD-dependent oxidoreductase